MFEVQMLMLGGWENCWHDGDDKPQVFSTREEAEAAIDEHLADAAQAVEEGFLDEVDERDSFRVVPVGGGDVIGDS